jgi:hypothetical protein
LPTNFINLSNLDITDLDLPENELSSQKRKSIDELNKLFATMDFRNKLDTTLDVQGKDIWNRHGILAMIFIQKFIENLTGKSFGPVPQDVRYEEYWLKNLFANQEFVTAFKYINWNDPTLRSMLELELELIISNK